MPNLTCICIMHDLALSSFDAGVPALHGLKFPHSIVLVLYELFISKTVYFSQCILV